jgi:hypothetical protein
MGVVIKKNKKKKTYIQTISKNKRKGTMFTSSLKNKCVKHCSEN